MKSVGPTWGDKVSSKALQALIVFFVVIAVYLTFRFEWRMALAAIIAVIHDIIITVGVYAITQFEVDAGHGRGVPDHPRVLALRHRRRVRQGEGQPGAHRHGARRHLLGDGQPVAEPGADAVDQHLVRGGAAGGVAAVRGHVHPRWPRAPRLRARAVRRSHRGRVLVDLRRHARCSPGSRSASRATARCGPAPRPTSPGVRRPRAEPARAGAAVAARTEIDGVEERAGRAPTRTCRHAEDVPAAAASTPASRRGFEHVARAPRRRPPAARRTRGRASSAVGSADSRSSAAREPARACRGYR